MFNSYIESYLQIRIHLKYVFDPDQ